MFLTTWIRRLMSAASFFW